MVLSPQPEHILVSFAYAPNHSALTMHDRLPRSRTMATFAGRSRADLESELASRCRRSSWSRPAPAYSSETQQPVRATAALGKHQRTRQAGPSYREQRRAGS